MGRRCLPGGAVVKNLPANAGDTGSSPGLGRSHMPRSDQAREPQLLSLRIWSLCFATREAVIVRGPYTTMKSGPHLPQLEKALAQKRRPDTAIKKSVIKFFLKKGRRFKQTFLQRRHADVQQAEERMFNIANYQTMQIIMTVRYHLTLARMAIIRILKNNKCWRRCREKGALLHCWGECKLAHPYGERQGGSLKNQNYHMILLSQSWTYIQKTQKV